MAKTLITRDQLGRLVLETIRKESGCEGIKEVWISQAEVLGCGPSWRVSVLDEGDVDFDAASHAARRVEERLNPQYELILTRAH